MQFSADNTKTKLNFAQQSANNSTVPIEIRARIAGNQRSTASTAPATGGDQVQTDRQGRIAPSYSFDYSGNMETNHAISALNALGHATRLAAFRLLVEAGPPGRMAGDIAQALSVPNATLSFHLKELVHAGLVRSENVGRNVCYRADYSVMNALLAYLTHNCCAGASCDAPGPSDCG